MWLQRHERSVVFYYVETVHLASEATVMPQYLQPRRLRSYINRHLTLHSPVNSPIFHVPLTSTYFLRVVVAFLHHTMNNFDYTDADSDATLAAFRSELHEYMRNYSQDCAPQGIHTVTANENLQGLNVPHDTTSTTVPTTLMGTFTETNYTHPVSKQQFDR